MVGGVKAYYAVLLALVLGVGCVTNKPVATKPTVEAPKIVVAYEKLKGRDDLWYFEGKPFTGITVEKYENGQKRGERTYKDGKVHGLYTFWYENGQKKEREYTLRFGKLHGLYTRWYRNGQKNWERTHKDGELISEKEWDEDGNLTREYPKPPKPSPDSTHRANGWEFVG